MRAVVSTGVAAVLVFLLGAAGLAGPALPGTLTIGTNPPGTLFYALGSGVAKILSEHAGLRAVVQPYSGRAAPSCPS